MRLPDILSDDIWNKWFFLGTFYQISVKLSGQHYVTFSFNKTLFKTITSWNRGFLDYEESDFKKQIALVLKRSVNFYIEQCWFFKDSFLMASNGFPSSKI